MLAKATKNTKRQLTKTFTLHCRATGCDELQGLTLKRNFHQTFPSAECKVEHGKSTVDNSLWLL